MSIKRSGYYNLFFTSTLGRDHKIQLNGTKTKSDGITYNKIIELTDTSILISFH